MGGAQYISRRVRMPGFLPAHGGFNHSVIQRETRETRLIPKGSKFSPLQLLLKPKPIILNSNYTKLLDDKVAKILRNLVYGSALVTSHRRRAFNSFPTKIKQISI